MNYDVIEDGKKVIVMTLEELQESDARLIQSATGRGLTVKDVAERLRCSRSTVYKYVHKGLLPMIKVGCGRTSTLIISEAKLEKFLEEHHYEYAEIL